MKCRLAWSTSKVKRETYVLKKRRASGSLLRLPLGSTHTAQGQQVLAAADLVAAREGVHALRQPTARGPALRWVAYHVPELRRACVRLHAQPRRAGRHRAPAALQNVRSIAGAQPRSIPSRLLARAAAYLALSTPDPPAISAYAQGWCCGLSVKRPDSYCGVEHSPKWQEQTGRDN